MDFCYADYFGNAPSTGYETLLYDCLKGDATLFRRADGVEEGWRIVTPILDAWRAVGHVHGRVHRQRALFGVAQGGCR